MSYQKRVYPDLKFQNSMENDHSYGVALCSVYDELYELNVTQNTYKIIYYVENKYVAPAVSGVLSDAVQEVANHMIYPGDRGRFLDFFDLEAIGIKLFQGKENFTGEFRKLWTDGKYHWAALTLLPFKKTGADECYLCYIMDIEEKKRLEFDSLTGILNEESLYFHTEQMLASNPHLQYAFIRVDIDRFKFINEIYGLTEGDKLLCLLANILQDNVHKDEVCGRITNDIFCFLKTYQDIEDITSMIHSICEELGAKIELYKPILSFGIYLVDDNLIPANVLCDRANLALRSIKGNWARSWAIYDDSLRAKQFEERIIESEMEKALYNGEFCIYLQPKHSLSDKQIIGAEVLVRWQHPQKGLLLPGKFMPLFEKNGFIVKMDEYVWKETFKLLASWRRRYSKAVPVSINISRVHVYNPDFVDKILGLLDHYDIPPALVELELTESAFVENTHILYKNMAALQARGMLFSMDDFGSGYSSLHMLKDAPVDIIKLDRGFLTEGAASEKGTVIVQNAVLLARRLKLGVIAEGVETKEQVAFLINAGCTAAQGFIFSRPMPVADFEQLAFIGKSQDICKEQTRISELDLLSGLLPDLLHSLEEQMIQRMLDAVPGGIIGFYIEDGIPLYFVNKFVLKLMGYASFEELAATKGLEALNHIHESDRASTLESLNAPFTNGEYIIRHRLLRKDGSFIWVSSNGKKFKQSDGRDVIITSICDITEIVEMHKEVELYSQKMLEKSQELENFYNTVVTGIAKIAINEQLELFYLNIRVCNMVDYSAEEILSQENLFATFVHPEDRPMLKKTIMDAVNKNESSVSYRYRLKRKDGCYFWVQMNGRITDELHNGCPVLYCLYTDVDRQEEDKLEQRRQEYLMSLIASSISGGTLVVYDDDDYTVAHISDHLLNLLDYSKQEFLEFTKGSFARVIHADDLAKISHATCETMAVNEYYEDEFRLIKKDGSAIWVLEKGSIALDKDGKRIFACLIVDITNQRKQQEQLLQLSRVDNLTGLLNRNVLESEIREFIAQGSNELSAFLILDLDNFKQVNDACGHLQGDKTLTIVGRMLRDYFAEYLLVGRWGGDEFCVLGRNIADKQNFIDRTQALCLSIDTIADAPITSSVGIVFFSGNFTFEQVYKVADIALYQAKAAGKNTVYSCEL